MAVFRIPRNMTTKIVGLGFSRPERGAVCVVNSAELGQSLSIIS